MKRKELKMSERLQAVAAMVTKGNVVCDVGCDHGFVPVYLVKNGISPRVIAMDINEGPLAAAKEHIGGYFLSDYIETRLSDGVAALQPGEADTLICAGMGGRLVIRILDDGRAKLAGMKELVLQPQSDLQKVREYLRKEGYSVTDENMILEDGKYYQMMRVSPRAGNPWTGNPCEENPCECNPRGGNLCEGNLWAGNPWEERERTGDSPIPAQKRQQLEDKYGPVLLHRKHPVLKAYLQRETVICQQILANLKENGRGQELRQQQIEGKLEDIRMALSCFRC